MCWYRTVDTTDQTQAAYIIAKFGGVNQMARSLGYPYASIVQGWKARGFIPGARHQEILTAASVCGVDLKPEDFVHHLSGPDSEQPQAAE